MMQGGLGNQLFQYFAGAALAKKRSLPLVLEIGELGLAGTPRIFELESLELPYEFVTSTKHSSIIVVKAKNFAGKLGLKLGTRIFISQEIGYDEKLELRDLGLKIKGYFQSWRYVYPFQDELRLFVNTFWTNQMKLEAAKVKPIVMHIRRGDYLASNESIGALSIKYFKDALSELSTLGVNGRVWVFTDSPELIDAEFLDEIDGEIISTPVEASPAEILSVMSLGKGIVISNSTFSWWAAYMNMNCKVIAPEKWFKHNQDPKDLCPDHWIRVKSDWQ